MSLKEYFDLVFLGVLLCVSVSIPFFWLKFALQKEFNKLLSLLLFLLISFLVAFLFIKYYN